ncbi:fumarylacetoacetate hydrolase family protein [Herbaspirillum sp.]|uniref:2-keto-4-pentenoate hydratase n=1 Tax=Herbaspirillum sp. TaxID=1890675 RepID=UPI0025C4DE5F|nr:fumarylacetoacetate hydrolase family protein [Herbaspirillum sp.]
MGKFPNLAGYDMTESHMPAQALYRARKEGARIPSALLQSADRSAAYAIQDATLAAIGPIGGWKVGAARTGAEPTCAPLPAQCLLPDGVAFSGPAWRLRGIEAEVAFLLGADLPPRPAAYSVQEVAAAIVAVMPVIEVVETRLSDWFDAPPPALLADLLSHGALVMGPRQPFDPAWLDLRKTEAVLHFNDQVVAHTVGGHPCPDIGALLAWLANHCMRRNGGLKRGQVLTTGSCTGMLFASQGMRVNADIAGLAPLSLSF